MSDFLNTTEDLWEKGPYRKLWYMRQYNVQHDHLRTQGMAKEEAKAMAHLAVQKKLAGLLGTDVNGLFDRMERLELLELIHHQKNDLNNPIAIELLPKEKYISGWVEEAKLELLHAMQLNYDEWEVMINKMEIKDNSIHIELV